jgi:hypothetical protein
MRKPTIHLIVALLTFLLGLAATTMRFINRSSETKIMPAGRWEPFFFKIIDERTKAANLPCLRTVNLPEEDVEVRVWIGFGINGEEGFILRRSANQWSGLYLKGTFEHYPPEKYQEQRTLSTPKSGWEKFWRRLIEAGILTLPDASAVGCNTHVLDGGCYVVEINTNKTYRTYMYDNPHYAKCDEAKRMIGIIKILYDEFGL